MSAVAEVPPCERCRSALEKDDLRCPICALPTPPPPEVEVEKARAKVVRCESCGAAMEYSAEARAPRCDYCGSVMRVEVTADPVEQAEAWLPFTVDEARANAALRTFLGRGGLFRPSGLAQEAAVETLRPMWWPAWCFHAGVDVSWAADSNAGSRRSDWAPHAGRERFAFEDILVPASRGLKVSECQRLAPAYRLDTAGPEGRGPESARIERFEATRSGARRTVLDAVERLAGKRLEAGVIPGTRHRNLHVAVVLSSLSTRRLSLPVYVLAYRYRKKLYRVLVHGQDEATVLGELPVSVGRVAAFIATLLAVLILLALFLTRR